MGCQLEITTRPAGREAPSTMGTILVSTVLSFATVTALLAWFALTPQS
jgi:hypothetical protein